MRHQRNTCPRICLLCLSLLLMLGQVAPGLLQTPAAALETITNLQQLTAALATERHMVRNLHLELTVCAASRPKLGVIIAQDPTGFELLELGDLGRVIRPGERLLIQDWYSLARKRELGVELSTGPVADNDGLHVRRSWDGNMSLKAGLNPLRLDWFNGLRQVHLEVSCLFSNQPLPGYGASNFWHATVDESTGQTNLAPGLVAQCYEGYWESVPDFTLLKPVKVGVVSDIDVDFRTRDEMVGIRYTGYFNAPYEGRYTFRVRSHDGSMLFLKKPELPLSGLGVGSVPPARAAVYGESLSSLLERRWATIEGRAEVVSRQGEGLAFDLRSDKDVVKVCVADAAGLDPATLPGARLQVTGLSRGALTFDHRLVLARLVAASAKEVAFLEKPAAPGQGQLPITSVDQVQSLHIEDARRALPVRIRGVVTGARNSAYERWFSLQDEARGIFVSITTVSNAAPAFGELVEVVGHTAVGDFAPVVKADEVLYLGEGRLPEPVRPTWNELVNGSRDVQWAELQGLVTDVETNRLGLLLPEGRLDVHVAGYSESELKSFEKSIVRIRGVLYAEWNADTREVRVGSVLIRNATIGVDMPAPADPFDAPRKTPRELFLFDPQASAFQRVKVRGQVVHVDAGQVFVVDGEFGMRILPAEGTALRAGEWVEAVGYPEISGPSPLLREALVRKIGSGALPAARAMPPSGLLDRSLDATRVRIEAKLVGLHEEQNTLVLQLEAGNRLFFARLAQPKAHRSFPVGSVLALSGVYVGLEGSRRPGSQIESWELLLNSPSDVAVISQPPWWTLRRLLTVVGVLLLVLVLAAAWIALLRRQVEQRTRQLQHEIRERERAERQQAIEAERSRIARDLHDDLGSSLTEIGVLASTGQRRPADGEAPNLFRAIASKARGLIAALDVIVWAVDPEDNSLQSLADYLSGFVEDFASNSGLSCRFKVPVSFPPVLLDGQLRHGLLMVVKESLNNVVRHAAATEVEFRLAAADGVLEIVIADNGKGFDVAAGGDGHGMKNLPIRLTRLGGNCQVNSVRGQGTTVSITLPLPAQAAPKDNSVAS